jgi:hypothetical protein
MTEAGRVVSGAVTIAGIPAGMVGAVVSILQATPDPIRRRALLEELDRRGRKISLAGLNRVLQQCAESGQTQEGPDGVRLTRRTP